MSLKISFTPEFEKQLKALVKKYRSLPDDLKLLIDSLYSNPTSGKSLGHGIYKIRIAITSKTKGKSSGARVITYYISTDNELYLLLIYDKSDIDSISKDLILALLNKLNF